MARMTRKQAAAQMATVSKSVPKFATHDSFANFLAQVGVGAGTGNISAGGTYGFDPISRNRTLLEWAYRGSWLVGNVVDAIADDMTRAGIELSGDLDPEAIDDFHEAMRSHAVWEGLNQAMKWARLYGGAVAVMMIDGQNPTTPLRIDRIGKGAFRGLTVLDRWMVQPSLQDLVTEAGPDMGMPRFYDTVINAPGIPRMKAHYSRVIRLDGVDLPYYQRISENLWGISVIERLYDRLLAFDSTTQGAAQLVYKAHLRTIQIENLREIIAAGGKPMDAVTANIDMIRAMQRNEGLTVLDAKDKFEAHQYSFSGLDALLLQFGQQLSGATGIPLVRLFGQSPAGLNATGDSDIRNYYDNIKQQQERRFRRGTDAIARVICKSEEIPLPDNFGFFFNPLWQLTDVEKADVASKVGETVGSAFSSGLIGRKTALMELRQSSRITGIFSNITDEDIDEAEEDPPDPMAAMMGGDEGEDPDLADDAADEPAKGKGGSKAKPKPKAKSKRADDAAAAAAAPCCDGPADGARDVAWNEADHPRASNGEFGSGGGGGKAASINATASEQDRTRYGKQLEEASGRASEGAQGSYSQVEAVAHMSQVLRADQSAKITDRQNMRCLYAERDGKLAAAGLITRSRATGTAKIEHLGSIEKGAGAPLMDRMMAEARNWRVKAVTLETEVPAYYAKWGFKVTSEEGGIAQMKARVGA